MILKYAKNISQNSVQLNCSPHAGRKNWKVFCLDISKSSVEHNKNFRLPSIAIIFSVRYKTDES